jgi:hypothetical protein
MRFGSRSLLLVPAVLFAACQGPTAPEVSGIPDGDALSLAKGGPSPKAAGGGIFDAGVPVHFEFSVRDADGGGAMGSLRFRTVLGGEAIDFTGRATCYAIDTDNNRVWVGGVVTRNRSTHPSFTTPIHAVGKDIWFRAVDYGPPGQGTPDRITFVGFEGGGGIITSAEYCAAQIWPDDDARTGPLTAGNLTVH